MRAAYFSDFTDSLERERIRVQEIKTILGDGQLFGVMSGNYLQDGFPAGEPKKARAEKALKAGVDLVLEQSNYASLSSLGIYAFGGVRILDKLGCVDTLVLETEQASLEQLLEIAYVLIANTREFQQSVSRHKEKGLVFYEAQAEAVGEFVEQGKEIMSSLYNIFAVECIKSLKLMYSSISCICIPRSPGREGGGRERMTRHLSQYLEYQLYFSETHLSDIYGGYEELTNRILRYREGFVDFQQFSRQIAGEEKDVFDVRKYFLRLMCGMTKSSIAIWRMYDFSPYCRVYAEEEALRKELKESNRMVILDGQRIPEMDRSKRDLLRQEERAEWLYRLQMREKE
ncbi:MAG: nucleotidyltransferase family protein [Lachnospiraceae bacterium]|nr:nucleotidyltransferase family protein [Lachnospiraceae bacterium]